ncbi:MAG: hypothetical protein J1F68_04415 [Clostridiales bacterium]|nr:hypothetical protein [Clostridiales bacterium]
MKRKTTLLVLCVVALVAVLVFAQPQSASADMGPKPSINITFKNLGDGECYGTILSKNISTGPHSAYAPDEGWDYKNLGTFDSNYYYDDEYHNEEVERIWQTFVDYKDADGYYFLQLWWKLDSESNVINWNYYPPYSFKLLLYYPESNSFVTSGVYERYAFDSYYTVDMSNVNDVLLNPDTSVGGSQTNPNFSDAVQLELHNSYDYLSEIVGLLLRIALTILVELLIALLFRIKGRKAFVTILITNAVTQIALNVALNLLCYFDGFLMLIFLYLPLEMGVIFVEAVTYGIALYKCGFPIWKALLYALVANVVSGGLGFVLAWFIPGLF